MKKFQSLCIGAVLGVLPLTVTAKPAAAIVVNGGFEVPDVTPGTYSIQNPIPGWSLTADSAVNSGIEIQDHIAGSPYEGNQFVELDGNAVSGIEQTLSTTINQVYQLKFAFSPRSGTVENLLRVSWGGNVIDYLSVNGFGNSDTVWQQYVYEVVANSTSTILRFDNLDEFSNTRGSYIDAVSVTPVPEPLTMGGLAIGAGFGAFLKKRYAKKDEQMKEA